MPTPKQLAALKKGRATMATNRAKGIKRVVKKAVKKVVKNPAKRVKRVATKTVKKSVAVVNKFIITVILKNNKKGYLTLTNELDTELAKAGRFSESVAMNRARTFFDINKKYLKSVQVDALKK